MIVFITFDPLVETDRLMKPNTLSYSIMTRHTAEIVENVIRYLKEHPANYQGQVDTLLELLYQAFTKYNSVETPEFRKQVDPLDEILRSLVETDEEADEYMNIVFGLCTTYERQGYIEGIKDGMRLMMELMDD